MDSSSHKLFIRAVVICVLKNDNKILVSQGYDSVKSETYYRPLGGGIDFYETSIDALRRELQEEISAEIHSERYIGMFENIFYLEGIQKHEIMLVYEARF